MKREGWQHGVLMARNPSLHLTDHKLYIKAPPRPSNHSKHTGKCRRPRCAKYHSLPVSKSRDKAKGEHKLRSCNVKLNHKLVSWRVVDDDGRPPKLVGASASDMLSQLSGCYWNDDDEDYHEDEIEEHGDRLSCSDDNEYEEDLKEDEDRDDDMGFCEVGFIMEYLEKEDWCMVSEI